MGQRLNIEIMQGDKPVCNVYMHWSAYTTASKDILNNVIDEFDNEGINSKSSLKDIVLALMNAIEGARTTPKEEVKLGIVKSTKIEDYHFEDYKDLLEKYPNLLKDANIENVNYEFFGTAHKVMSKNDYERFYDWKVEVSCNRDSGIISTTEEGMNDTRHWAESCIEYDFVNRLVYFGVNFVEDINDTKLENKDLPDDKKEYTFEGDDIYYNYDDERYKLSKYNLEFDRQNGMTILQWKEFSDIIQETASHFPYTCIINDQLIRWIE